MSMITLKKPKSWISFLLPAILAGCYYDNAQQLYPGTNVDCNTVNATFVNVKTIVAEKCSTAGCHDAGSAGGGIVLETYDQIRARSDRIRQRVIVDRTMPPGSPLSSTEVAILKCWISSGSPNN
jgi:uncharacterized membrane protein